MLHYILPTLYLDCCWENMTRFARAKGSKASNERREEEATPWHVMRQQLADQLNGNDSKSKETVYNIKYIKSNISTSNKEEIWSDFGEPKKKTPKCPTKQSKKQKKSENEKCILSLQEDDSKNVSKISALTTEEPISKSSDRISKKKRRVKEDAEIVAINSKKKRTSANTFDIQSLNDSDQLQDDLKPSLASDSEQIVDDVEQSSEPKYISKHKKNNLPEDNKSSKIKRKDAENPNKCSEKICDEHVTNEDTKLNSNVFTSKPKFHAKESKPGKITIDSNFKDKHSKYKNSFQNPRYNSKTQSIIANDREIKVKPYEGFLVRAEDAKELTILRKKLKSENVPQEQIKKIMKLERRKAEKALAREKTKVCFHCRKFGHKLSDCPEVDDKELAKSGVCFKCGSTEHSYFDCKVSRGQDFRHAVCFVCKEQGHIARQCPLNPQGQYPRGGSCHLCGEVTHLRKDCPKAKEEQAAVNSTVNMFTKNDLEEAKFVNDKNAHKKKSIVKF